MTNPLVYYGIPLVQAILIAAIAFTLLEDTVRLAALGVAVVTAVVSPQILKRAMQ